MAIWKQSLLAVGVLLLAGAGWLFLHPGSEGLRVQIGLAEAAQSASGRPGGGGPPFGFGGASTVVTAPVGTSIINDRLSAVGDGAALRSVDVISEVSGRVTEVLKGSGERVEAGDVLVQLDASSERIALSRAQLAVRDAQNALERLNRLQRSSITEVEISQAETALAAARLQVQEAELALSRRTIRAPMDGMLGIMSLEPGALISSQTVVARIDDRSGLLVEFRIPERFVSAINVERSVEVTPVAQPGLRISGTVTAIDSRLEPDSRTLRVQAQVPNEDDLLRPGMSFLINIRFAGDEYPTVDPLAIQWQSGGPFVWQVLEGRVAQVPVRIIQRNSDSVLVDAELSPGEVVVTEGVQSLRPGAEVRVASEPPANGGGQGRPAS
ncbi:MAG: efflux RND transporter periplasmic adaptor subunit [Saccharospirillum sp.]